MVGINWGVLSFFLLSLLASMLQTWYSMHMHSSWGKGPAGNWELTEPQTHSGHHSTL